MKQVSVGAWFLAAGAAFGLLCAASGLSAQDIPGAAAAGATPDPPISEIRLPVHTLLREDIFAGFLENDMTRFARGEKNIALLQDQHPDQKANLLAWKGGALLYRAVLANEGHRPAEYRRLYRSAKDLLAQAATFKTGNDGVAAVTGGSYVIFADRLPKADRAAAWTQAYNAYHALVAQQSANLDRLPVHFRGEALGGLATAAARTGHTQESKETLDKMLVALRDTPYEPAARKWSENPTSASNPAITCLSCHENGRLSARLDALDKK